MAMSTRDWIASIARLKIDGDTHEGKLYVLENDLVVSTLARLVEEARTMHRSGEFYNIVGGQEAIDKLVLDRRGEFAANLEVEAITLAKVPASWLSEVAIYPDILGRGYIGYWARGISYDKKNHRRLIWEFLADPRADGIAMGSDDEDQCHAEAIKAFKAKKPLPKHYHVLDAELAVKAWALRAGQVGVGWADDNDADDTDLAIQMALLGDIVYG
jgi:hypothetical protein